MTTQDQQEMREQSTGDLLKQLSDHTTTLVKQEIDLAKAELSEKGKKAGAGAGMFGGAGLFAVFAFAAVTTCLIAALESPLLAVARGARSWPWSTPSSRACSLSRDETRSGRRFRPYPSKQPKV